MIDLLGAKIIKIYILWGTAEGAGDNEIHLKCLQNAINAEWIFQDNSRNFLINNPITAPNVIPSTKLFTNMIWTSFQQKYIYE